MIGMIISIYAVMALLIGAFVFCAEVLRTAPSSRRWFVSLYEAVFWPAFVFNFIANLIVIYREEHR